MTDLSVLVRPQPGPETLKEVRWGGDRLAALRGGAEAAGRTIGESWELSTMAGAESRAAGRPLSEILGGPLPFLVKLIDTAAALSIQVHPDDAFAPGRPGKEEAWVILDAKEDAELLCGLRPGTDRDAFADAVAAANADPAHDSVLVDLLRRHRVRAGTCIVVPAGTVHAIGAGILLMEIQQPVDRTFRLYDYGSGRELHVEQGIAALHPDAQPVVWSPGDERAVLRGAHVELEPGNGDATIPAGETPCVVVSVRGEVEVAAKHEREVLSPGDLVLVRSDATLGAGSDASWVRARLASARS